MSRNKSLVLTTADVISSSSALSLKQHEELLGAWSFPDDEAERRLTDAAAQTPGENGKVPCWRRKRRCTNSKCVDPVTGTPYRFKAIDREMWNCPICGKDRHCRKEVHPPNRGCEKHGGATPRGWDLPQTKTGEHSKYIKVDSVRADFEKMLASPQLFDLTEDVAFIQARINQVMSEYGGGASRALLRQMKQNRAAYKKNARLPAPDVALARQLDRDLDKLISNGSKDYQVMEDWRTEVTMLQSLIQSHDQHMLFEKANITPDKAWSMLAHMEETF